MFDKFIKRVGDLLEDEPIEIEISIPRGMLLDLALKLDEKIVMAREGCKVTITLEKQE